jgi:membrane protease YdiL (CAAX protease family)
VYSLREPKGQAMPGSAMHQTIEQSSNRAVRAFLMCVIVLGAPLIVAMYLVDTSTAEILVLAFMVVPAVSAILARLFTGVHLTIGRPSLATLLLATIPGIAMGLAYGALAIFPGSSMAFFGWDVSITAILAGIAQASVLAFGEELGWRGYLLPQLRRTRSFMVANSILVVIWFAYHVPVIFVPGVYSNPGIPTWASLLLFAVAITGFSFFVGALWEKHHDVWGATFAHGVWNYLVQGAWPLMFIAASPWVMGEFGVVAGAITVVIALVWVPRVARRHRAPLEM